MQYSRYNVICKYGNSNVVFNLITGSYIFDKDELYSTLVSNKDNVDDIYLVDNRLVEGRFVVDSNEKEMKYVLDERKRILLSEDMFKLMINTTYDCNFACKYCTQTHSTSTNISKSNIEKIITIVEEQYNKIHFKKLFLSLFGGEPLYNYQGVELIVNGLRNLAERYGFCIEIFITTNGSIISNKLVKLLLDLKVTFQITVDGDKERHNKVRPFVNGTPSYDVIIENITKMMTQLPKARLLLRVNYDRNIRPSLFYGILSTLRQFPPSRVSVNLTRIYQEKLESIPQKELLATVALFNRFKIPVSGYALYSNTSCAMSYKNALFVDYDGTTRVCSGTNAKAYTKDEDIRSSENYEKFLDYLPRKCKECLYIIGCLGPCIRNCFDPFRKANIEEFVCESSLPDNSSFSLFLKQEIIRRNNAQNDVQD